MTREEAIYELLNAFKYNVDDLFMDACNMAIEALKADTVEVVRCKDCRHAYYADNRVPHERTWVCERFTNEEINANDFCSFGERSEE